jgi:exodeoxyribonuclease-3
MSGTTTMLSWNVNGIRGVLKKGFLNWIAAESPDILCIQETKAHPDQLPRELVELQGYFCYWSAAERKGYSGVAVFSKEEPVRVETKTGVEPFDSEGRFLMLEYEDFTLFNVYFPNGKASRERLDFKMDFYADFLDRIERLRARTNRIVFCGDVNTAHNEIDLARPKENEKVSGFLPIERQWIDKVISLGWVDTFRHLHPDEVVYSWWDLKTRARERNVGWRIDYVFVSKELLKSVKRAFILTDVMGSDHCPVGVELVRKTRGTQ